MSKNWKDKDYNLNVNFGTDCSEFERYVGRPPKNEEEMDNWVHYLENGVEAQLDWDIINSCASDNFNSGYECEDCMEEYETEKEAKECCKKKPKKK